MFTSLFAYRFYPSGDETRDKDSCGLGGGCRDGNGLWSGNRNGGLKQDLKNIRKHSKMPEIREMAIKHKGKDQKK